ncbi:MAG: 30S ribosome-binding factor RbfA [Clostridia bacterium]|nr:30S ribosome-binding factor RbfA [Clostridia bacterium]
MKGDRCDKLNSEFRKEIDNCLRTKFKHPDLTEMFTVLDVECDRLLIGARVYISIFSTDKVRAEKTFKALCTGEPFVRHCLSKTMHLRKIPRFTFILDDSNEKGSKIDRLINEIHKNDDTTSN